MRAKLNIDFKDDQLWIENSYTLRRIVGILGMSLPVLLWLFLYISKGTKSVLPSISHYYFTRVDGIFMITIGIMGMFLIIYKGKALVDFYVSLIAGICALLLLLFPTSSLISFYPDMNFNYANTVFEANATREALHFVFAALFLLCLAFMSIFVFTKSNKPKSERGKMKNLRNNIYTTTGVLMVVALLIIALKPFYIAHLTFWMETIAIELFGFSWLVKGEALFKDR